MVDYVASNYFISLFPEAPGYANYTCLVPLFASLCTIECDKTIWSTLVWNLALQLSTRARNPLCCSLIFGTNLRFYEKFTLLLNLQALKVFPFLQTKRVQRVQQHRQPRPVATDAWIDRQMSWHKVSPSLEPRTSESKLNKSTIEFCMTCHFFDKT